MLDRISQAILEGTLTRFSKSLESSEINTALELFQDDCYWCDLVTFPWNLRTMEGKGEIRDMLTTQLTRIKDGRIWTLLTTTSELKGFEESKGINRPMSAEHGVEKKPHELDRKAGP